MKSELEDKYLTYHLDNFKQSDIESYVDFFYYNLKSSLDINKKSLILDFGCGKGEMLLALRSLGYSKIYGLDRSIESLEFCKKKGLEVFESIDSFKDSSIKFDFILLFDVIEHASFEEGIELINSIKQILKENGKLIIKTPNASSLVGSYSRYNDLTHKLLYTENSISTLITMSGMKLDKLTSIDPFTPFSRNIIKGIFKKLFYLFNLIINYYIKVIYFALAPYTIRHSKVHLLLICSKNT